MSGARGDALDWALALAQAPGERDALRRRPLPDGMEALLQIASGSQGAALQAAVARTGEAETRLVEAVRFYLREVLFYGGADAYRTLGLTQGASQEQIKGHHRLLQHWLHPDRQTSDWDAIFAGRVNAAWNALRTPERRAAYDAEHPGHPAMAPESPRRATPRVLPPEPMRGDPAAARWRRRAPVLALFAACGVLGVAAVRDALREPVGRYSATGDRVIDTRPEAPVALRLPERAPESFTTTGAAARRPWRAAPRASAVRPPAPASTSPIRAATSRADVVVATAPSPLAPLIATRSAVSRQPTAAAIASGVVESRVAVPPPRPAPSHATADRAAPLRAPVAAAAPPAASGPVEAAATPTLPAPDAAARIQLAQRTGDQLLAFLSGTGKSIPPIWDSLGAQQRALAMRETLRAPGAVAGDPVWRVAGEDASLRAAFGDGRRLRAQLVWRDQRWLVSGVSLEQ